MRVTSLFAATILVVSGAAFGQGTTGSSAGGGSGATAPAAASASKPQGWAYVEKASAAVAITPGTEDIAPVLFPALAAIKPAPAGCDTVDAAMLLGKGAKGWDAASAWAQGADQQAVLKALTTVTDPKKKYLLGIPYGTQGLDPAWVKAGLCVELPPSGLLQGAKYRYRAGLDRLVMLVNVEATRLASEGKPDAALTKCVEWLRLARIVAEREGVRERRWGMNNMMLASERMRDIAYTFRDKLTAEMTRNAADDLDERLIGVRRIRLPLLEKLAAEQLVERVIIEKGEVDTGKFASTMARLSADQRSLNLFGQAAWYRELAASHAGWFDTKDQLNKVFGGWANRWNVENLHDDLLQIPSDYLKMDKARFALLELTGNEIEGLERLRLEVMTQLAGTRVALGVVGYERKEKRWPPNVSAIAPAYVRALDTDPFGYDKRFKNLNAFYYKVPIRDDVKKEREEPKPHEMTVGVGEARIGGGPDPMLAGFAAAFKSTVRTGGNQVRPEDLDFDAMLADLPGAKKRMIAAANEQTLTDQDLAAMGEALKITGEMGDVTPEQLTNLVIGGLKSMGGKGEEILAKMNEMLGVSMEEYLTVIAQMDNAANKTPAVQEMRTAAKNGTKLTSEMVRKANVASMEALTSDEATFRKYLEMMSKIMKSPAGGAIRQSFGLADPSSASSTFTVTITQKDYLLWSTGPDARDDQARAVGVGGSDVLIWPPILSLRREHGGN